MIIEPSARPGLRGGMRRARHNRRVWWAVAAVTAALFVPYYYGGFGLQAGTFIMAAAVGAIGLNLLVGSTGQLSLAHAFFIGLGAYGYAILATPRDGTLPDDIVSGGLPPAVAALAAVGLSACAGAAFSPIAGRLRGLYLGVASLGLVYLGLHVMHVATPLTGGYNGRAVPPMEIGGFRFDATPLDVGGVTFGQVEKLWYLNLIVLVVAFLLARNIARGRPGRALEAVRDSEVSAAVMGVNVQAYKAMAFILSSMYAGAAGVLLALTYQRIVPESFQLGLSIDFLAMITIGGLGSVTGALLGAAFVVGLQQLLPYYSGAIPFLAEPGSGGVTPGVAARLVYAVLIIVSVRFVPGGMVQMASMLRGSLRRVFHRTN